MVNVIIILVLIILVVFAIRYIYKQKKKGKCAGCPHSDKCNLKNCDGMEEKI